MPLTLIVLEDILAVCKLPEQATLPDIPAHCPFFALTITREERSVVLPQKSADPAWHIEAGWVGLKIDGVLSFDMVGIIAALSQELAAAEIPLFVVSTYDTDYILVKQEHYNKAETVLTRAGYTIRA